MDFALGSGFGEFLAVVKFFDERAGEVEREAVAGEVGEEFLGVGSFRAAFLDDFLDFCGFVAGGLFEEFGG